MSTSTPAARGGSPAGRRAQGGTSRGSTMATGSSAWGPAGSGSGSVMRRRRGSSKRMALSPPAPAGGKPAPADVARWARPRLQLDEEVAQAQPGEELGLRRAPEDVEAGLFGDPLERRPVHVRGHVLLAHAAIWGVAGRVAAVGAEKRAGSLRSVVELSGGMPVVDDEGVASLEPGAEPPEPGLGGQPHLRDLALDEPNAGAVEGSAQLLRVGGEQLVGEPAVAPRDVDLEELAFTDGQAVDRQRVQQLVRDDQAGPRLPRGGPLRGVSGV